VRAKRGKQPTKPTQPVERTYRTEGLRWLRRRAYGAKGHSSRAAAGRASTFAARDIGSSSTAVPEVADANLDRRLWLAGPDWRIDRKPPGVKRRVTAEQEAELGKLIKNGPQVDRDGASRIGKITATLPPQTAGPEEPAYPPLGAARHQTVRPDRPAYPIGLSVWRDLPRTGHRPLLVAPRGVREL
jgi:hypothetical protein